MKKRTPKKSILSFDDAPIEKKSEREKPKFSIIQKGLVGMSFRVSPEAFEYAHAVRDYIRQKTGRRVTMTQVFEEVIIKLGKSQAKIRKFFRL